MKSQDMHQKSGATSAPDDTSWQFIFVMIVIAVGVLGIVGKTVGLF
jgi:hypothetical protein